MKDKDVIARRKEWPVIGLICVAIYAYIVRLLHLLDHGYYYVISPDSYFFHWQARQLLQGASIPMSWHSGMTYPIAYASRVFSAVCGASTDQSLRWASVLLPPVMAVVSIFLLYWVVSRVFDPRVAFFYAFAWAAAPFPIVTQGAGYLDRDGLSVIIITAGAFLFYLSSHWRVKVLGVDFGWLLATAALGGVEILLYLEWVWLGPVLLLAIISFTWAADVLFGVARGVAPRLSERELDVMTIPGSIASVFPSALKSSRWRPLVALLLLNAVVAAKLGIISGMASSLRLALPTLTGSGVTAELRGISLGDLLAYNVLLVALLVGLAIGLKRLGRADSFAIGWFAGLFGGALFIGRLLPYADPAICLLVGVGLGYLLDIRGLSYSSLRASVALADPQTLKYVRVAAGMILILLSLAYSFMYGYRATQVPAASADRDWQEALLYLRDNSSPQAVVMCHWTYGYFVRDLADRETLEDNGNWDEARNADVALAYTDNDPAQVAAIMARRGLDYFIFSADDYFLLPAVTKDAFGESYGDGNSIPPEVRNSVYARSLFGDFISGGGLQRIYPDASVDRPRVVILALQ